jgi:hypothetical protein
MGGGTTGNQREDREVKWQQTEFGVQWGPLGIERTLSDEKDGYVCLRLFSKKNNIYVMVKKGGKMIIDDRSKTPAAQVQTNEKKN